MKEMIDALIGEINDTMDIETETDLYISAQVIFSDEDAIVIQLEEATYLIPTRTIRWMGWSPEEEAPPHD